MASLVALWASEMEAVAEVPGGVRGGGEHGEYEGNAQQALEPSRPKRARDNSAEGRQIGLLPRRQQRVRVREVLRHLVERRPGEGGKGLSGGGEVLYGRAGRAVHGDGEEALVEALAVVEDEGLALLHGQGPQAADEC